MVLLGFNYKQLLGYMGLRVNIALVAGRREWILLLVECYFTYNQMLGYI